MAFEIPSLKDSVHPDEWQLRLGLAACYRLVALHGWLLMPWFGGTAIGEQFVRFWTICDRLEGMHDLAHNPLMWTMFGYGAKGAADMHEARALLKATASPLSRLAPRSLATFCSMAALKRSAWCPSKVRALAAHSIAPPRNCSIAPKTQRAWRLSRAARASSTCRRTRTASS